MKIKHIIIILFIFLSVIPLSLFGITNMMVYNDKMENILENDLKIAVSTQIKAIENFYEERQTDAKIILGFRVVKDLLETAYSGNQPLIAERRAAVEDLLKSHAESSRFIESITLIDKNFVIMACSDKTDIGEVSELQKTNPKYLSRKMQFTSLIQTEREGNRKNVVVAVQEIYDKDEFIGYIVFELNLSFFEEVRVSASLFNNGTIYLIDGNKQMIVAGDTLHSRESYVLHQSEREDYQRAWNARDPNIKEGILKYVAQGDHYLSCYSGLTNMDWTMISSINCDEVMHTKEGYRDLALLILLSLIFLLIAVNYFITRNIAVPVRSMIARFEEIKTTRDYSIRMDAIHVSEIGIISTEVNSLLSSIEDYINLEKEEQERLKEKAERDSLTGLFNTETMEQLMRIELDKARAKRNQIACLFLDVDDFKSFNTRHGHVGGDRVLCFIAENLSKYAESFAGRQGGDEFVACICNTDARTLEQTLKDLLGALNTGVLLEDGSGRIPIHCSIGAALSSGQSVSYTELITRADEAMYAIKQVNKNGYLIWNSSINGTNSIHK